MTWLDYAVLGVLGVSVLWGVWRGLVREVISIAGWVLAFIAAYLFAAPLASALPRAIPTPELRMLTAFMGVFIAALVVATLCSLLLSKLVKAAGLGGLDRVLGSIFGLARGLLIVLALALVAGLTAAPRQGYWRNSVSGGPMGRTVLAIRPWLPPSLAVRLRYH
ncbi:MAG: CvpA family protein [Burkholderiales bacterium]